MKKKCRFWGGPGLLPAGSPNKEKLHSHDDTVNTFESMFTSQNVKIVRSF